MCAVCHIEDLDTKFFNGSRSQSEAQLYRVYVGQGARMILCHIHNIELFSVGESRFLSNHIKLVQDLSENKKNYVVSLY